MPHSLIVGGTESGKTTLAVRLAAIYKAQNIKVIVLDPMLDQRWCADVLTTDPDFFLSIVRNPKTRSCALFIDESGETVGRYKDHMFWLATRARHYGHNSHFISQRATQIAKTVRDQCRHLFLFSTSLMDCKALSDDFNEKGLLQGNLLEQGEYFHITRWDKDLTKHSIFEDNIIQQDPQAEQED